MKTRWVPAALLMGVIVAGFLGGCEDMFAPASTSRNYDELVDRMVKSMKGRSPEDAAANLFNVTSPDERRDAVAYLETKKWGHEPPYMKAYEVLVTDPHPMVRAQAMRALGSSYQAEAGPYLVKGLDDKEIQVRRDAAQGLIGTWDDAAAVPLAKLVKDDPDDQVRIFAAQALAHARTPDVVRALIDGLSDNNVAVVKYSRNSLVTATGQDFSYERKGWLTWYQQTYVSGTMPATRP